jgi:hypothetical protein
VNLEIIRNSAKTEMTFNNQVNTFGLTGLRAFGLIQEIPPGNKISLPE